MTFDEAWQYRKKQNCMRADSIDEQHFRHGWNAALRAAEEIVAERYDECEPWLEPGDIGKRLEVEVQT